MIRYIELIEPFDQNGYTPDSVMASSPNGDWVLYSEAQAEIDALKAQNADLLKALHNLTENVVFYHRNGISDLKDAKADRNNAVKIALIAIGIEADPDLEFSDWQPSPAIAKARGES